MSHPTPPEVDRRSDTERRASEIRRVQDEVLLETLKQQADDLKRSARSREIQNWILIGALILSVLTGGWDSAMEILTKWQAQ